MATGYGRSSSTYRNQSPTNGSGLRRNNTHQDKQDSTDLNQMTLDVVNDFKNVVEKKIKEGNRLTEAIVELEVANIKRAKYPDKCNFYEWKKKLPHDLQVSDAVLRVSMAYGNDSREIEPILETKMNKTNANNKPTGTSLNNLTNRLKSLKRELDNHSPVNVFRAIRNIENNDNNRADRLFFSEARHCTPGVKEFTFTDAQNAVQAIRQTTFEADDPKILIPIIKTCRDTQDVCDYLDKLSGGSSKKENQSSKKPSRGVRDDDDDSNTPPTTTTQSNNPRRTTDSQPTPSTDRQQASLIKPNQPSRFPNDDDDTTKPAARPSAITNNNPTSTSSTKLSSKSELPTRSSRFNNRDDDNNDRHSSTPSTPQSATNSASTPTYEYKPFPGTYRSPSQSSNRSTQNDTKSRDETTRPSRFNEERQ